MKRKLLALATCTLLGLTVTVHAQNGNSSQAGGLPALAAEVAELRALIESLQGQVGGEVDYSGTFAVTMLEIGRFGCGFTNDPASLLGTPLFIEYLGTQGISSSTTSSAFYEAESDGWTLSIPEYQLKRQQLRLSGVHETETRTEGPFDVDINADGSLSFDPGAGTEFAGQMAVDGNSFNVLVRGQFIENGCDDSFTVLISGVRK